MNIVLFPTYYTSLIHLDEAVCQLSLSPDKVTVVVLYNIKIDYLNDSGRTKELIDKRGYHFIEPSLYIPNFYNKKGLWRMLSNVYFYLKYIRPLLKEGTRLISTCVSPSFVVQLAAKRLRRINDAYSFNYVPFMVGNSAESARLRSEKRKKRINKHFGSTAGRIAYSVYRYLLPLYNLFWYQRLTVLEPFYGALLEDYTIVRSEYAIECLWPYVKKDRALVVGYAMQDILTDNVRIDNDCQDNVLVLVNYFCARSQSEYLFNLYELVQKLVLEFGSITIKVHPRNKIKIFQELFKNITKVCVIDNSGLLEIIRMMKENDFVIGSHSTLLADAILANCNVIGWIGFKLNGKDYWKEILGKYYHTDEHSVVRSIKEIKKSGYDKEIKKVVIKQMTTSGKFARNLHCALTNPEEYLGNKR